MLEHSGLKSSFQFAEDENQLYALEVEAGGKPSELHI